MMQPRKRERRKLLGLDLWCLMKRVLRVLRMSVCQTLWKFRLEALSLYFFQSTLLQSSPGLDFTSDTEGKEEGIVEKTSSKGQSSSVKRTWSFNSRISVEGRSERSWKVSTEIRGYEIKDTRSDSERVWVRLSAVGESIVLWKCFRNAFDQEERIERLIEKGSREKATFLMSLPKSRTFGLHLLILYFGK